MNCILYGTVPKIPNIRSMAETIFCSIVMRLQCTMVHLIWTSKLFGNHTEKNPLAVSGDICSCACPDIYGRQRYIERYIPDTSVPIIIYGAYPDSEMAHFLHVTYPYIVYLPDTICFSHIVLAIDASPDTSRSCCHLSLDVLQICHNTKQGAHWRLKIFLGIYLHAPIHVFIVLVTT